MSVGVKEGGVEFRSIDEYYMSLFHHFINPLCFRSPDPENINFCRNVPDLIGMSLTQERYSLIIETFGT